MYSRMRPPSGLVKELKGPPERLGTRRWVSSRSVVLSGGCARSRHALLRHHLRARTHPSDVRSTRDIHANVMWLAILPGGMV